MQHSARFISWFSLFLFSVFLLGITLFTFPSFTNAQAIGIDSAVYLTVDPAYPKPNSSAQVRLEAYSLDTNGASIQWYINGVEDTEEANARTIIVQTGSLGSQTRISAVITSPENGQLSVQTTIIPADVDMVVEGDTLIPSFYKGRALPVGDEKVTITAVPHISGYTSAQSLVYSWKLGNAVLFGGPVRGDAKATFTMPKSQTYLTVTVTNTSGQTLAKNTILLKPANPELYFYEDNPLRGMSTHAIDKNFVLVGDETTIEAKPYFVGKNIFSTNPVVGWTIDGNPATSGETAGSITLRATGGSGNAKIGFNLMSRTSFLQAVEGFFSVSFE